jgi:hypothetical protein
MGPRRSRLTSTKKFSGTLCTDCTRCLHISHQLRRKVGQVHVGKRVVARVEVKCNLHRFASPPLRAQSLSTCRKTVRTDGVGDTKVEVLDWTGIRDEVPNEIVYAWDTLS